MLVARADVERQFLNGGDKDDLKTAPDATEWVMVEAATSDVDEGLVKIGR
jgi:hypothetical protein